MTHPHTCQADRDRLDDGLVLDTQPAHDTDEVIKNDHPNHEDTK